MRFTEESASSCTRTFGSGSSRTLSWEVRISRRTSRARAKSDPYEMPKTMSTRRISLAVTLVITSPQTMLLGTWMVRLSMVRMVVVISVMPMTRP